jgi:hypothetical protein
MGFDPLNLFNAGDTARATGRFPSIPARTVRGHPHRDERHVHAAVQQQPVRGA